MPLQSAVGVQRRRWCTLDNGTVIDHGNGHHSDHSYMVHFTKTGRIVTINVRHMNKHQPQQINAKRVHKLRAMKNHNTMVICIGITTIREVKTHSVYLITVTCSMTKCKQCKH